MKATGAKKGGAKGPISKDPKSGRLGRSVVKNLKSGRVLTAKK